MKSRKVTFVYAIYSVQCVCVCGGVCECVFLFQMCIFAHVCSVTRVVGACACELNGKQSMMSSKNAGNMHVLYVGGHGKKDMQTDRKTAHGCRTVDV